MVEGKEEPARIREVFGNNLRVLVAQAPSVSQVCRDIGVNRTQFNRYLGGESFPRPDVLKKICDHFDVDARILLQPMDDILDENARASKLLSVADSMLRYKSMFIDETSLPSGHYLLYRHCYFDQSRISTSLFRVSRTENGFVELEGYMPRKGASRLGLGVTGQGRRLKGNIFDLPNGFAFLMTLNTVPAWHFGMMTRYYLGNPGLYNGMSVSTHNPMRSFPVLLEQLPDGYSAMLKVRGRLTSLDMQDVPHYVRSFFSTAPRTTVPR